MLEDKYPQRWEYSSSDGHQWVNFSDLHEAQALFSFDCSVLFKTRRVSVWESLLFLFIAMKNVWKLTSDWSVDSICKCEGFVHAEGTSDTETQQKC